MPEVSGDTGMAQMNSAAISRKKQGFATIFLCEKGKRCATIID
jgi:hypothetical protein